MVDSVAIKTQAIAFDFFGTLVDYTADRRAVSFPLSFAIFTGRYPGVSDNAHSDAWDKSFRLLEQANPSGREFLMRDVAWSVLHRLGVEVSIKFDETSFDISSDTSSDISAPNSSTTTINPELNRFVDQWVDAYMTDWSKDIVPVTGAVGLLRRLSKHYQLALISNTHHAPTVYRLLNAFDFSDLFSKISLSAEYGYAKPHRLMFDQTLRGLGVDASQAVYVGDSFEADYCGGTDAGLTSYLIGRHARVPRDRQLRNIQDLAIYFDTTRG